VTLPGTANTSQFCSKAQRAVMRVPLYSPAYTTSTPADSPLKMASPALARSHANRSAMPMPYGEG
jgi:hypothetical protein